MDGTPFIYLFKTCGAYYIYDINKNSIIKTEKKVWELLEESKCGFDPACSSENTNEYSTIKKLKESGFLSSNKVKEILHPVDEILDDYISNKILMINLQVTQQCNLRCEYCAFSGGYENRTHANQRMTFEMAKKGIDFLIEHSSDLKRVAVGFYGGEPLLEFKLIKNIIKYVNENVTGKDVIFTITTNATLLNREIIDYFYRNNVSMLISLDGPKEIHDKNRKFAFNNCGTFESIVENINLIKRDFPEYMKKYVSFNAVIDPQTDVGCVCKFFNDFETVKEASVMYSQISDFYSKEEVSFDEEYYTKINYEYFKLFMSKLKKLDEKYTSRLVLKRFVELVLFYNHLGGTEILPEKMHHAGPCIPGTQRLFLNASGDFYPCEKVSETSEVTKIGDIEHGLDIKRISEILNIGKLTEENCKNCWAFRFCNLCIVTSDNGKGLSKELKVERCYGSIQHADNQLKDICTLKEFGYKFA